MLVATGMFVFAMWIVSKISFLKEKHKLQMFFFIFNIFIINDYICLVVRFSRAFTETVGEVLLILFFQTTHFNN